MLFATAMTGPPGRRLLRCVAGAFLGCFALAAAPARGQALYQDDLPAEPSSPEGLVPGSVEPGLTERAIPEARIGSAEPEQREIPLYRLTRPYYSSLFAAPPENVAPPSPSSFRAVISYEPPIALRPRVYRTGLFEVYPWIALAQSYDSNVNLSATDEISDFYLTPRGGIEFQLGTPDSAYLPGYDTIVALRGSYEGYGDLFYGHPDLSAYNQKLELAARIGRSSLIVRPFFYASDTTGTDLLSRELTNRTRRIRLLPGVSADYQVTDVVGWRPTFSYFRLDHPDPDYINLDVWRTLQEFSYRLRPDFKATLWGEYRATDPSRGARGTEVMAGLGWAGKPDSRLYSELRLGWDFVSLEGPVPGRSPVSGLRFNGYTTFQWGPRFALTFRYDRDYVFNELTRDDNYVSTLLQWKGEFYLGENWYVTPYFGAALDEFETSRLVTVNYRPEIEISYALPDANRSNESRIFVKIGYQWSDVLHGEGQSIHGTRISVGTLFRF